MKKLFLGTGFFVFLLAGASAFLSWRRFAWVPLSNEAGSFTIDVAPGAKFFSIRRQLQEQGIVIDPFALRVWIKLRSAEKRLRVGEYVVQKSWTRKRILDEILSGAPVLHKFIVKEGHNVWDVQTEMARIWGEAGSKEFNTLIRNDAFLTRMGVPATMPAGGRRTLEGYLFPETYSYQKYDSPKQIFEAMLTQFESRAKPLFESHPWGSTPEGRYRLLTLASIVEKESGNSEEQPLIASVFWNRIRKGMRLQSDPTTIYALLPDFDGNLKRVHLTTPSAYNTYTLPELPAGPIANPGESAIKAVLNPATTRYLYFVARGGGNHVFSEDYKTHAARVREFQIDPARAARAQAIKATGATEATAVENADLLPVTPVSAPKKSGVVPKAVPAKLKKRNSRVH